MTVELDDVSGSLQVGTVRSSDQFVCTRSTAPHESERLSERHSIWIVHAVLAIDAEDNLSAQLSVYVYERAVLATVKELPDEVGVVEAQDRG